MLDRISRCGTPTSPAAGRAAGQPEQLELELFDRSPKTARAGRGEAFCNAGLLDKAQAQPRASAGAIEHPPLWGDKHKRDVRRSTRLSNEHIEAALARLARVVARNGGESFQVRAYLQAAESVRQHRGGVAELVLLCGPRAVREELMLGPHVAAVIEEIVHASSSRLVDGLEKKSAPARLPVGLLLALDARYRALAVSGQLHRIAPKRFNPEHRAWLPIMQTEIRDWQVRAMYSNTERAHDFARTSDWVIIVAERDGLRARATVVTERYGVLRGRRVVRGREQACRDYYRRRLSPDPSPNSSKRTKRLAA